jgi:hypothetical protein
MKPSFSACLPLVLGTIALSAGQTRAVTTLTADITHAQEPPPNGAAPLLDSDGFPRPLSFGTATFVLNDAQTQLTMTATIFNIDVTGSQSPDNFDNLVSAHIHGPAVPGVNAGVRWGFFGAPDNDNNPDNLVVTPFATGVGGTFTSTWDAPEGNAGTTLAAEIPSLIGGTTYINFHTVQFPGGEIRGQIVPEPALSLLAAGGLLTMFVSRRRKTAGA